MMRVLNFVAILFFVSSFAHAAVEPFVPQKSSSNREGENKNQKCGKLAWDLNTCVCPKGVAGCGLDSRKCSAVNTGEQPNKLLPQKSDQFKWAYVNFGRCDRGVEGDCRLMKAASQKLLKQRGEKSNDQWNEPWRDPSSQLTWLKFSQDIQVAKQKGFTAIEPDNSAELTTSSHLIRICATLKDNQMKLIVKNENMGAWFTAARHPDCKAVIAAILPEGAIARNEVEKMERIRKVLGSEVPIFYVEYGDDWKKDPKKLDGLKESEKKALLSGNTTVVHLPDRKIARGVSEAGCVAFEKKESDGGAAEKSKNDMLDIYKNDQGLGLLRESVDTTKCSIGAPVGATGACVQFSDLTPLAVPKDVLPKSI